MDYDVIVNRTLKELIADVKTRTSQGWELQGGISVNANFYCQAMVKPEIVSGPAYFPKDWEIRAAEDARAKEDLIAGTVTVTPKMLEPLPDPQLGYTDPLPPKKRSHKKKQ